MNKTYKVTLTGGSHPRLVDYRCSSCDVLHEDVFYDSLSNVLETIPCTCGGTAEKLFFSTRCNFIHPSHSSMYGKENPAFGCVVEDYAHKQRLMKQFGVIEGADPVGGSRNHWKPTPERPAPVSGSSWVDHPDDLKL